MFDILGQLEQRVEESCAQKPAPSLAEQKLAAQQVMVAMSEQFESFQSRVFCSLDKLEAQLGRVETQRRGLRAGRQTRPQQENVVPGSVLAERHGQQVDAAYRERVERQVRAVDVHARRQLCRTASSQLPSPRAPRREAFLSPPSACRRSCLR